MRQARPWFDFLSPSRHAASSAKAPGVLPGMLLWYAPWRISRTGLILVIAAHLALLWAIAHISPTPTLPLLPTAPVLSVDLLMPSISTSPPQETKPPDEPVVRPPVVRPTPVRPTPPAPVLTTSATTAMESIPQVVEPPRQEAETPRAETPVPAPANPAPQPPRFDAAYLDNPRPPYPMLSRRMGEQGTVQLRVQVDAGGQPLDVKIHVSSGSPRLDNAALEAVRRWRFVPARQGNTPVAASVIVPIVFSLKD